MILRRLGRGNGPFVQRAARGTGQGGQETARCLDVYCHPLLASLSLASSRLNTAKGFTGGSLQASCTPCPVPRATGGRGDPRPAATGR